MAFDRVKYNNDYLREHSKQVSLKFFYTSDADILERLEEVSNYPGGKRAYIKYLIRKEMETREYKGAEA